MRSVLLMFLLGCDPQALQTYELDRKMNENQEQIERIHQQILEIEKRATEVRTMVRCINAALDSRMNDRDQVLTIEECVRTARFR